MAFDITLKYRLTFRAQKHVCWICKDFNLGTSFFFLFFCGFGSGMMLKMFCHYVRCLSLLYRHLIMTLEPTFDLQAQRCSSKWDHSLMSMCSVIWLWEMLPWFWSSFQVIIELAEICCYYQVFAFFNIHVRLACILQVTCVPLFWDSSLKVCISSFRISR